MNIVQPDATLLWITPSAEKMIELAARTCYKSEDKITEDSHIKLIKKLIEMGHHAMLEHASASIKFICDRGVTHELVRHHLCAYAQESTRYCNYGKDKFSAEISAIQPPDLKEEIQYASWIEACRCAEKNYLIMVTAGCPPQIARSVLPTCLKTEIVCTANLREWRHIFSLRLSIKARPQIKEIMRVALSLLKMECPTVFADITECPNEE
jgi:thymidylate synthase (FAD)